MAKIQNGAVVEAPTFSLQDKAGTSKTIVKLSVQTNDGLKDIVLSEQDLSRHVLTVGSIGSGKTNLIDLLICQISQAMTKDDVMLVFDTKGDYLRKFSAPGDVVFGNIDAIPSGVVRAKWNIYEEVKIDPLHTNENLIEICKSLFLEKSEHTTNPFFPNAAKDILYGYMLSKLRSSSNSDLNNAHLLEFFSGLDIDVLRDLLSQQRDLKSCLYYIKGDNLQTQGVISEVVQEVHEIFVDSFAQIGTHSIRKEIRNKNKKKIFVEYDLGLGNMLTPIYRLLLDLAIKEALCRNSDRRGNVYIVIDEFSLLPNLQHISDGVNFGRELGIKFIVGVQSIEQVYAAYGEHPAGSILAGFDTRFFFKVNDYQSRKYVQDLLGKNKQLYTYDSTNREKGSIDVLTDGNVIEDWVYCNIPVGAALYSHFGTPPQIVGLPRFQGLHVPPVNEFNRKRDSNPSRQRPTDSRFNIIG